MKIWSMLSIISVAGIFFMAHAEPNGAILVRENTRYGHYNVPGNAGHHYFNLIEGPAWENKHCAFRMYIDKDDRNAIDVFGKLKPGAILEDFNTASDDPHATHSWGSDILSVGSSMGFGSFRLLYNNQWINPQLPETIDSLVISIVDSSVETPKMQIGYYGWNIGGGNKITVLWTLSTRIDDRATHCELSIEGDYSGKVVAGMVNHSENTNNPNRHTISVIQDEDPPLLATLGKQSSITEGYDDTLLMAIYTDHSYFDSFNKQGSTNLGMVLIPDDDNKVKWSIAYSWAREEEPLFRQANWKEMLVPITNISRSVKESHAGIVRNNGTTVDDNSFTHFSLNGRSLGKWHTDPQQCAKGIYILRNNRESNRKFNIIYHGIHAEYTGR